MAVDWFSNEPVRRPRFRLQHRLILRMPTCTGAHRAPWKSADGSMATERLSNAKRETNRTYMRVNTGHEEMACGSKELDPPFPFPPGESRGGESSPHAAHAARQQEPLARIDAAAPPARGISRRSAEIPLARSPWGWFEAAGRTGHSWLSAEKQFGGFQILQL